MVTIGQRRLGRTIRKLEDSVEFSSKESKAQAAEKNYVDKIHKNSGLTQDSPIQNLREIANKKEPSKQHGN